MAVLTRLFTGAAIIAMAITLAGCGGGSLTTAATDIIDTQRRANLTRDKLTGLWDGEINSSDGIGSQTIQMEFAQGEGFALDGSILVGTDIRIGRAVVRDTFALMNGVFIEGDIRFNLAPTPTSPLILAAGNPVLFTGLLSENGYMSGQMKAGGTVLGYWEAVFNDGSAAPPDTPEEEN